VGFFPDPINAQVPPLNLLAMRAAPARRASGKIPWLQGEIFPSAVCCRRKLWIEVCFMDRNYYVRQL
jgi:hypothetical protein